MTYRLFLSAGSHLLHGGSVLELYAPPGYVFYNNSFVSLSGIVEVEGQHGSELVGSDEFSILNQRLFQKSDGVYVYRTPILDDIPKNTEFTFTVSADLPDSRYSKFPRNFVRNRSLYQVKHDGWCKSSTTTLLWQLTMKPFRALSWSELCLFRWCQARKRQELRFH